MQQFAQRGISERTGQAPVLEEPFEVKIFNANNPIAVSDPCGELVKHIISHTGDTIMQPCHLPPRLLAVS
jgi:hypothetical protein